MKTTALRTAVVFCWVFCAANASRNTTLLLRMQACGEYVFYKGQRVYTSNEIPSIIDHTYLELFNDLMRRTEQDAFSNQLNTFQELSSQFFTRGGGCTPLNLLDIHTREELRQTLDRCLCKSLRVKLTSAVSQYFRCDLQTAGKDSLHAELASKANRYNVFARYRIGLYGGIELLKQYDALVDRCFHEPLRKDKKIQQKENKRKINNSNSQSESSEADSFENFILQILWTIAFVIPLALIIGLAVLMSNHIQRNYPHWRPFPQRRHSSDDTQLLLPAASQQSHVVPELSDQPNADVSGDVVAELVDDTVAPRRASTDPTASVNHPD